MTRCLLGIGLVAVSIAEMAGQQCIPPPAGMVAWYTGDGTSNDFVGTNNGTLQNGVTFASGMVAQAFSLNGVNQFVSLPSTVFPYPASGARSTQPISVDAWFSTTTGGVILGQQGLAVPPAAPAGAVPAIYVGTDGFLYAELFWKGAISPLSSAPVKVNDGAFHLVAVTYDGSTEAVYLDGVQIASDMFTEVGYASSYQYQIGTGFTPGWPGGNGNYFYFQGLIDEVEIFNRALAQSEIQSILNARSAGKCKSSAGACLAPPSGMVAWYTGDGTVNDFFGKYNGVAQNGATFAPGMVAQAFSLNGVNQFVSLPDGVISYPLSGATSTQPISVDTWFSTTTGGVILGQLGLGPVAPTGGGAVPAIYVGTDGFLYAQLFWKGVINPFSSAPVKVNNGAFHLVAVTYDGSTEAVYLDGALIASGAFTQVGYAPSYQYQIGTGFTPGWPGGNGSAFYFQGLIDEVEIFNRALAPSEVQAIASAGSAGKCKNQMPAARCKPVTVSACTTDVSINDNSFDPDGDPITLVQTPAGPYPVGATSVTLTVTDNHGASSQCTAVVTVTPVSQLRIDSLTADPHVLWPPNHKMVPVTVTANPLGECGAVTCKIISVTSNETLAADDVVITGDLTVKLRATRSGKGSGRVYTITVQCTGSDGSIATKTVTVTVPHDQGDGDSGDDNQGDNNQGDNGNGGGKGDHSDSVGSRAGGSGGRNGA
jgi:hypothetical protein